jgi:hypothetical protein
MCRAARNTLVMGALAGLTGLVVGFVVVRLILTAPGYEAFP